MTIKSKLRRSGTMNSNKESAKTVRFALQRKESQASVEEKKNDMLPVVSSLSSHSSFMSSSIKSADDSDQKRSSQQQGKMSKAKPKDDFLLPRNP